MMPSVTFIANSSETLEIVLDSELNDARCSCLGRNAAERACIEVYDGVAPVEVVEEIERLQAELQPLRAGNSDQLRHREINVPEVRTHGRVAREVTQRARRR